MISVNRSTAAFPASGFTVGGDTNLYRSAADTLKTDDNISTTRQLLFTGTGATPLISFADAQIYRVATGIMQIDSVAQFAERADPSAPAANNVVLYSKDNGSGKTQLVARFPTGAVQVLATEP